MKLLLLFLFNLLLCCFSLDWQWTASQQETTAGRSASLTSSTSWTRVSVFSTWRTTRYGNATTVWSTMWRRSRRWFMTCPSVVWPRSQSPLGKSSWWRTWLAVGVGENEGPAATSSWEFFIADAAWRPYLSWKARPGICLRSQQTDCKNVACVRARASVCV